jgi:hypothetical protein
MPMTSTEVIQMVSSVSNAQPVAQPAAAPQPAPQSSAPAKASTPATDVTDTVRLSSGAQLAQEAIESSTQTAKEANAGDSQARRLLAREAAEHSVGK